MNDLEKFEESLRALKPRRLDPETAGQIEAHLRQPRPAVRRRLTPDAWAATALAACALIAVGIWFTAHTPQRQPMPCIVTVAAAPPHLRLEPTLMADHIALARSPEALDALLLEQAKATLTRSPGDDILSPI